jgi:hypothetical protein
MYGLIAAVGIQIRILEQQRHGAAMNGYNN